MRKREELESTVAVLQQHVKNFQTQMMVLQSENDLEQYGRQQAGTTVRYSYY